MQSIINNLKYYQNPELAKLNLNPFQVDYSYFPTSRNTLPRTETIKNKKNILRSRSKHKYIDQKDDSQMKTTGRLSTYRHHNDYQLTNNQKANLIVSQKKPIRGMSNNKDQLRFSKQRNSVSVKKSAMRMRTNELFFCEKCYLYLFKIQIDYHYPDCSSDYNVAVLSREETKLIGMNRLTRLQYSVKYTNHPNKQEILDQIQQIKSKKYQKKKSTIGDGVLSLSDCDIALELIYNRFFSS